MNSKSEEPQNSEKPEEVIDEIVSRLDGVHEKFVEASASIGYARDALRSADGINQAQSSARRVG